MIMVIFIVAIIVVVIRYSAKQIMDYAKYLTIPVNRLEKYMELYL